MGMIFFIMPNTYALWRTSDDDEWNCMFLWRTIEREILVCRAKWRERMRTKDRERERKSENMHAKTCYGMRRNQWKTWIFVTEMDIFNIFVIVRRNCLYVCVCALPLFRWCVHFLHQVNRQIHCSVCQQMVSQESSFSLGSTDRFTLALGFFCFLYRFYFSTSSR